MSQRWNNASHVEQIVWDMRLADLPRGDNRTILNQLYNGDPPFDAAKAEENNIEINRNDLEGVNMLAQARRQWMQAFLPSGNHFNVAYDSGPKRKLREWGHTVTQRSNELLKRSQAYMELKRATGGQVMLHGIGPKVWDKRRSVIAKPLPISSLMIPSETDVGFENLAYFALFREWTPAQLWEMTHGPKVDPGWNMPMVQSQWKYVREQVQKQPNATAYQYMPERIEELAKQDLGFWGSDAVPTIDVWDFYFRGDEDGKGWYRRMILDWGVTEGEQPKSPPNRDWLGNDKSKFLYTSGNRKYSNCLSEIMQCQIGDCSAVFPAKYHSTRSLGWMLWGVCDLQNRLHCKFNEAVFEQLMWFFRVASNAQMERIKKANFYHMGVIPEGVSFIPAAERFKPDMEMIGAAFARNRQLMSENATAYTQDFDKGQSGKEMTATETMARINTVNALVSGMLNLAYAYEEYEDRETLRRLCIRGNPDPMARKFRLGCLQDGVPPEMLDVERMNVTRERTLGGGNKTLEMAQVSFLQGIRKNLGPDAQRRVDHISIESALDNATIAEELAPEDGQKVISNSMHDAQLVTERLMRGLPFVQTPDMVYEDYVKVWLADLTVMVTKAQQQGGMATPDQIAGWANMEKEIMGFLAIMAQDPTDKSRVKGYHDTLGKLMNLVKAFAQRLAAQMKKQQAAGAGANGDGGKTQATLRGKMLIDQAKAANLRESHAMKTAQRQAQFELEEQRKDREANAEIRRKNDAHLHDLTNNRLTAFQSAPDGTEGGPEGDQGGAPG